MENRLNEEVRDKLETLVRITFGKFYHEREKRNFYPETDTILSLILPILAARAEKHEAEAVREALSKAFNPDWKPDVQAILKEFNEARTTWETEKAEAVEQVVKKERERIFQELAMSEIFEWERPDSIIKIHVIPDTVWQSLSKPEVRE